MARLQKITPKKSEKKTKEQKDNSVSSRKQAAFRLGSGKYHSNVFSKLRPKLKIGGSVELSTPDNGHASDEAVSSDRTPTNKPRVMDSI